MITNEMRAAACAALNERGQGNAITIADVNSILTAALALLPGEPVAWQWRQTYAGRWGIWNYCGLSATDVQKWRDLAEKLPNEVQVRPLYTSPTPHLSVDREALLEEAREAMLRMEWAAEQLASTRSMEVYDAMIKGGQTDAMLEFDNARRAARAFLSKLEGSSNAKA
ncbi:hypothetical protein [Rhizobium rhizogenes]|uniref:hypothetical protein n=1 Tax=Rhizobium rhizogenes TaxID=359 RepID=UPI00226F3B13|nr:hypothetical protein [Rhizobium rhizogenes]